MAKEKYGRFNRSKEEVLNMICDNLGTNKSKQQIVNILNKYEGIPKSVTKKFYDEARRKCVG